jgi:hypothetical protein
MTQNEITEIAAKMQANIERLKAAMPASVKLPDDDEMLSCGITRGENRRRIAAASAATAKFLKENGGPVFKDGYGWGF